MVRKKNGSLRICGDYRSTVNQAVRDNVYPLPTSTELFARLGNGRVFTKLDLTQAYQQLVLDDAAAGLATINTVKGLYKVRRLPYGISVAPGLFQRTMDTVLAGVPQVVAYLDDILIASETTEEHDQVLIEVLTRLSKAGLRANTSKCEFYVESLEFLGHKIDRYGIYPSQAKVEAIHQAPAPTNKKELQAFLGMVNFYNRFLKGRSEVAEVLHRLLDNGSAWEWKAKHQKAFDGLKDLLTSNSLLTHLKKEVPLVLSCDASSVGVGAVLSHRDKEGRELPIAYASRTLNKTERNYAQIDREALSIAFGVRHFHQYLCGRRFVIITDHKPLLGIFQHQKQIPFVLSPRMLRWTLMLSAYTYTLEYRRTQDHGNADGLSRLPMPVTRKEAEVPGDVLLLEAVQFPPVNAVDVARETSKDPHLSTVMQWIRHGWPQEYLSEEYHVYKVRSQELSIQQDCIVWGNRVILPKSLRMEVLQLLHGNHPGITAMKAIARSYVWWPKIDEDIDSFVKHCRKCQHNRQSEPQVPTHFWIKPDRPWSRIHIDFAGPVNGACFLVVVDAYSNWAEVEIVPSLSSSMVIEKLRKLFASYGPPDLVVSDNGTAFVSQEMQEFLKINGIKSMQTAPYHPASNGRAERMVQELKMALKKQEEGTVACKVSRFLFKQHSTPHAGTGKTPAELMLGRKLQSPLDKLHPDSHADGYCAFSEPKRVFSRGDFVYVRNFGVGAKWLGARVLQRLGHVMYKVQTSDGVTHRRHADHVRKAWASTPPSTRPGINESFKLPSKTQPSHSEPHSTPQHRPMQPPPVATSSEQQGSPQPRRSFRERRPVCRYGVDSD